MTAGKIQPSPEDSAVIWPVDRLICPNHPANGSSYQQRSRRSCGRAGRSSPGTQFGADGRNWVRRQKLPPRRPRGGWSPGWGRWVGSEVMPRGWLLPVSAANWNETTASDVRLYLRSTDACIVKTSQDRRPFGSLAISRPGSCPQETHGFASRPHDRFAFIEARWRGPHVCHLFH